MKEIESFIVKGLDESNRKGLYKQILSQIRKERKREEESRRNLIYLLMIVQGDFSDGGLKEDADKFTKHIKDIEGASIAKKEALMYIDSDLSEMIKREETSEEDRSRTTKKLEELGEDANE